MTTKEIKEIWFVQRNINIQYEKFLVRPSGLETFVRGFFSRLNKLILQFQHLLFYYLLSGITQRRKWMFLCGGDGNLSRQSWRRRERERERERGGNVRVGFFFFLLNLNWVGFIHGQSLTTNWFVTRLLQPTMWQLIRPSICIIKEVTWLIK